MQGTVKRFVHCSGAWLSALTSPVAQPALLDRSQPRAMPLSQEDLQVLTALVTQTVTAVMTAQATATPTTTAASSQANTNDKVDERHFRKMSNFTGTNWKDWAFQFRSATRSSNIEAHRLLEWAEKQTMEIADFTEYDGKEEVAEKLSGQLFNLISTMVNGEPLQLMHNC